MSVEPSKEFKEIRRAIHILALNMKGLPKEDYKLIVKLLFPDLERGLIE